MNGLLRPGKAGSVWSLSRRFLAVAVWGVLLLRAPLATAAPDDDTKPLQERLVVQPGATCLDANTLEQHVASWLGTTRVDGNVRILVRGNPSDPRDVSFWIRSGTHAVAERRFFPSPERCEHLHAVVGLAIALAIRASLIDEVTGFDLDRSRGNAWALAVEPFMALGVLPDWGVGMEARIERTLLKGFALRAALLGLYGPRGSFEGIAGHYETVLFAGRLDGCGVLQLSDRIDARACQGFAAGGLGAQGAGFARSAGTVMRWLAVANSLDVTLRASDSWSWNLGIELLVPLERTTVVVRGPSEAVVAGDEISAAGVLARVGPMYRF